MLVRALLLALLAIGGNSELDLDHESGALNYLLTEGLRVNPMLIGKGIWFNLKGLKPCTSSNVILEEETLSESSKKFISTKYDSFVRLVGQRQRAVSSRTKRSLETDSKTNSISK